MKLQKTFLVIIFMTTLLSCSSDDGDDGSTSTINGDIEITKLSATTVTFGFEGIFSGDIKYGLRKEGETDFKEIAYESTGNSIIDLLPAQKYELTILLDGNDQNDKKISFTTPPFNFAKDVNSKIVTSNLNVFYSEKGFVHKLEPDVYNKDAVLTFLLIAEGDQKQIKLTHTYSDNKINFTIPESSIVDEPYEEFRLFHLAYQIANGEVIKMTANNEPDVNVSFYVFNPTPIITGIEPIETETCSGNKNYKLKLNGHFMSTWPFEEQVYYKLLNSQVVITRDDDNTEIILNQEDLGCTSYSRYFVKEEASVSFSFIKLHTDKHILIKYPESTVLDSKFTTGEYKIKITFSNDNGAFYETNNFSFTLP